MVSWEYNFIKTVKQIVVTWLNFNRKNRVKIIWTWQDFNV